MFNARGRLVGVLWGTDGQEVVCVQAGRVHALLDEAVGTGAAAPRQYSEEALTTKPVLPWRAETENRDRAQSEQIDKLIELERLRAARESQPPTVAAPTPELRAPSPANEPSPLVAGLSVFAGVAVGFVIYFATQKG